MRWIKPSRIGGQVSAPASKSVMIRATAAASLGRGVSEIANPSFCDDALAGLRVAESLGAKVIRGENTVRISGPAEHRETILDCGESGLCLRMFAPIAALGKKETILLGRGSLASRPMGMIEQCLSRLGVACRLDGGFPPVIVKGPLRNGKVALDGSISSQLLTGLLMALPLCEGDSELSVSGLRSKPYVDLTLSVLSRFGIAVGWEKDLDIFRIEGGQRYQAAAFEVEGDWSGAAFFLVAAALAGRITVKGLSAESSQGDVRILEVLRQAGARVLAHGTAVSVEAGNLRAFEFDAADCPDLFPPLAALACFCEGRSSIQGVERLKHKESDRASALVEEFSRIGGKLEVRGNTMRIQGKILEGGAFASRGDHRMAMAGAVAGLRAESGVRVEDPQCVSKSYPSFFADLESAGGDVT